MKQEMPKTETVKGLTQKLAKQGGKLVSAKGLAEKTIETAKLRGDFAFDDDHNAFVRIPPESKR